MRSIRCRGVVKGKLDGAIHIHQQENLGEVRDLFETACSLGCTAVYERVLRGL